MAKIYVKLDTLNAQATKLKSAGDSLTEKALVINGEEMSGMKGGQAIVSCAREVNKLMSLFNQLITKNCSQIKEMGKEFSQLDQNLSK